MLASIWHLSEWQVLPNVSCWVLRTIVDHAIIGNVIQVRCYPPRLNGDLPTVMGPQQALVMEQEVKALSQNEAVEQVLPLSGELGFYSRYLIVPKKYGVLHLIQDLCWLNCTVSKL